MSTADAMHLKIVIPTRTLVDRDVRRVMAEGLDGAFGLLPNHVDLVAALVPGLLAFTSGNGEETLLALDVGVLVKNAAAVTVAARDGIMGDSADSLRETVQSRFRRLDQRERKARTAVARMEAAFVSRFLESREHA